MTKQWREKSGADPGSQGTAPRGGGRVGWSQGQIQRQLRGSEGGSKVTMRRQGQSGEAGAGPGERQWTGWGRRRAVERQ